MSAVQSLTSLTRRQENPTNVLLPRLSLYFRLVAFWLISKLIVVEAFLA